MSKVENVYDNPDTGVHSNANLLAQVGDHAFDTGLPDDIFDLTKHVESNYQEVFSDPPSYKKTNIGGAISPITEVYGKIYDSVQAGTYYVFAILLGWLLAIVWGIFMGISHFFIVWMMQPMWKLMFSFFRLMYLCNRVIFRILCDPFTQSCSLIFSNINGRFRLNMGGVLPIVLDRDGKIKDTVDL